MSNFKYKKLLRWLPVIIWMGVIFYLSDQPASQSSEISAGITAKVFHLIETVIPFEQGYFHHLMRKSAHFFAYFILGIFVYHALRPHHIKHRAGLALLICILYAISDEVHQLFIPGRSGEVGDVLLDGTGALVGIVLYVFIWKRMRRFF